MPFRLPSFPARRRAVAAALLIAALCLAALAAMLELRRSAPASEPAAAPMEIRLDDQACAHCGTVKRVVRGRDSAYRVTVQMEDGSLRTLVHRMPPVFAVGDRVLVENGALAAAQPQRHAGS